MEIIGDNLGRKLTFDPYLADRVNKAYMEEERRNAIKRRKGIKDNNSAAPPVAPQTIKPASLDDVVNFSGRDLVRSDYEALVKILEPISKKPEEFYTPLNDGKIRLEDRRVVYVDFYALGLDRLPEEVGDLTALQWLYLDNNQLTSLPNSIGNLTALQRFSLDNNQLTSIPGSIGNLTALQRLHLDRNQLTSLPGSIGNLTALQELNLWENKLNDKSKELCEVLKRNGVFVSY